MPKKVAAKSAPAESVEIRRYADNIEKFLKKSKNPYSEARLVEDLFDIPLREEGYIPRSKELDRLKDIRKALRLLMNEKKVVGVTLEDPVTNEQVLHYSVTGWYATP